MQSIVPFRGFEKTDIIPEYLAVNTKEPWALQDKRPTAKACEVWPILRRGHNRGGLTQRLFRI